MKRFKRILVATDTRFENHPIVAEAAEIAKRNNASLTVVDVVPEYPWSVRLLLSDHEHTRQLLADEKLQKLEAIVAPLQQEGVNATAKVLLGKTSVEIIREVMRGNHDLLMRVAKGKDSRRTGYFGSTGIQLLRKCPCAVWLVAPNTTPNFQHVMACVDASTGDEIDLELNDKIYELASTISKYHGGKLSVVQAWSIFNEQMVTSRMTPKEQREFLTRSHQQIASLLDKFMKRHEVSQSSENVHTIKGETAQVINSFAKEKNVDLVVMGTVGRSGLLGMIMGNTAEHILSRLECSVLAVKPGNFRSPIHLDGAVESERRPVFSGKPDAPK